MNVDAATWSFLILLVVIAANRLLLPALGHRAGAWFYWPIQALDALGAVFLLVWGMPGLSGALRILDFFVAGVLVLHILENHLRRGRVRRSPVERSPTS
ncbi:MAG: hypothetical protein JXB39_09700 [Deltaproteobacteria bacterium]|nr:hypothetical protein [Deltaproteobacteria bacterium]